MKKSRAGSHYAAICFLKVRPEKESVHYLLYLLFTLHPYFYHNDYIATFNLYYAHILIIFPAQHTNNLLANGKQMDYAKISLEEHEKLKGKIEITNKITPKTPEELAIYYSPGVAEPCRAIIDDPENAYKYTRK